MTKFLTKVNNNLEMKTGLSVSRSFIQKFLRMNNNNKRKKKVLKFGINIKLNKNNEKNITKKKQTKIKTN